jgi:dTMP kinase
MDERCEKFKGKLVVFEGPADHCGKSTLAKALHEKLLAEGVDVLLTKQPGDSPGEIGTMMRSLCIDKKWNLHSISNLFAFLLDRCEHTDKVVQPALKVGKTVICDRWYYSTIAYQFYGKELLEKYNLNKQFAYWMNRVASLNIEPDVVYFIERAQEKISQTKDAEYDQFETASYEFKLRVRGAYYSMLKENPLFVKIPVIEDDIPGTLDQILRRSF